MAGTAITETDSVITIIPTCEEEPIPSAESFGDAEEGNERVSNEEHLREWTTFDFGGSRSDLDLVVEDTKFRVSKTVLSFASPVFDAMFHSDFKETDCSELDLPGKSSESVHEFLRCICPGTLADITPETAMKILPLLEEYQVIQLKPRCESVLMGSIDDKTSTVDIFKLLNESCIYGLKNLRNKCVELASRKGKSDIDEARKSISVPPDALIEVFDKVISALEDENVQLKTHIECNSGKLENEETLRLCLLAQNKDSVSVGLNKTLKWKEHIEVMNFAADADINCCRPVSLWGERHELSVGLSRSLESHPVYKEWVHKYAVTVSLSRVKKKGPNYLLHVACMVVNKIGRKPNHCIFKSSKFTADIGRLSEQLITLAALKDEDNGYVKDDKISFVFLIYMSEPF